MSTRVRPACQGVHSPFPAGKSAGSHEQNRAVAAPVVDEFVAIHIPLVATLGTFDVDWERLQVAKVVGNAVGENLCRLRMKAARAWKLGITAG